MSDFDYVNRTYGLSVFKGQKVKYQGQPGQVRGAEGPYVVIRLDANVERVTAEDDQCRNYHPTDDDLVYADFNGRFPAEAA